MENLDNELSIQCDPISSTTSKTDFNHHLTEMYSERSKINIDQLFNLNQFYLYNAMKKKSLAFNIREINLETNETVNTNLVGTVSQLPTTVSSDLSPKVKPTKLLSKINL